MLQLCLYFEILNFLHVKPCIGAALGLLVAVASSPACHQAQKVNECMYANLFFNGSKHLPLPSQDIIAAGCIDRVVRALKARLSYICLKITQNYFS